MIALNCPDLNALCLSFEQGRVKVNELFECLTRLRRLLCGKPLAFRPYPPPSFPSPRLEGSAFQPRRGVSQGTSPTERQSLSAQRAAEPQVSASWLEENPVGTPSTSSLTEPCHPQQGAVSACLKSIRLYTN